MKLDQKLINALLDLLSDGKPINVNSLSVRMGVNRSSIYHRIKTHKSFIDVEIVND